LSNFYYSNLVDGPFQGAHLVGVARSADGGTTWTTSWVTSGSNDEAQPSMSADASGLHIFYEISPASNGTSVLDAVVSDSS
jgi:hypothetical protein